MEKEKMWFIDARKQKRAESKLSKQIVKTLKDWHYLDWKKYNKLPDRVAHDLIKQWYWNEVIDNIDKFNNFGEIIDDLMCGWYDITKFVLFGHWDKVYKLTYTRILNLIMYRPWLICRIGNFPWTDYTSVDEKIWKKMCLIDYEYFKYSWKNPQLRNKKSIDEISRKYFEMDDEDINWEYKGPIPWESYGAMRNWILREVTYWYNKSIPWFKEGLIVSKIKALNK